MVYPYLLNNYNQEVDTTPYLQILLKKIKEAEEFITNYLKHVKIIDNIKNPTGMYKYVRDYALTVGTYYDKDDKPLSPEDVEDVRRSPKVA